MSFSDRELVLYESVLYITMYWVMVGVPERCQISEIPVAQSAHIFPLNKWAGRANKELELKLPLSKNCQIEIPIP